MSSRDGRITRMRCTDPHKMRSTITETFLKYDVLRCRQRSGKSVKVDKLQYVWNLSRCDYNWFMRRTGHMWMAEPVSYVTVVNAELDPKKPCCPKEHTADTDRDKPTWPSICCVQSSCSASMGARLLRFYDSKGSSRYCARVPSSRNFSYLLKAFRQFSWVSARLSMQVPSLFRSEVMSFSQQTRWSTLVTWHGLAQDCSIWRFFVCALQQPRRGNEPQSRVI